MFKIQLSEGFFQNKSGRIQHFSTQEKADAKIKKMGIDATVVECKTKTAAATKEKPEDTASETKIKKVIKTKKAAVKVESASVKGKKKNKKSVMND